MPRNFHLLAGFTLTLSISSGLAFAEDALTLLKDQLRSINYNLVNPASNAVVPGGLVVSDNTGASYNALPQGIAFNATSSKQNLFGRSKSKTLRLAALINAIGTVLKAGLSGGLSIDNSSTETVNNIEATGQTIRPEEVIADERMASQIRSWMENDAAHYRVYVVTTTLSTSNISVSGFRRKGIGAAFGTELKTCPTSGSANGESAAITAVNGTNADPTGTKAGGTDRKAAGTDSKQSDGTKTDSKSTVVEKADASPNGSLIKPTKSDGTESTAAGMTKGANLKVGGDSSRGGSVQICYGSSDSITMSSTNPLVFAAALRPVTMDPQKKLRVGPVSMVLKEGSIGGLANPIVIEVDFQNPLVQPRRQQ